MNLPPEAMAYIYTAIGILQSQATECDIQSRRDWFVAAAARLEEQAEHAAKAWRLDVFRGTAGHQQHAYHSGSVSQCRRLIAAIIWATDALMATDHHDAGRYAAVLMLIVRFLDAECAPSRRPRTID